MSSAMRSSRPSASSACSSAGWSAARSIIETVFAIPGMGQLLFTSITARDYPVVQAITVITALLVIIVNLIVDLSYSFLDPRVTYE